jgi:hypothetical protein
MLEDHIFHSKHDPGWSGDIVLHASYAELSACAGSVCSLCMFFLREFWYGYGLWKERSAQDMAEAMEGSIAVRFYPAIPVPSHIIVGGACARFWSFDPRLLYDCPRGTQDFFEIREANPPLKWSLAKCKSWLSDCLDHHKCCGHRGADKSRFLPTRLLDVGSQKQQSIRLVLSKDLEESVEATYATLSYCWGATNDAACTTTENLIDRLEGIPVESLPRTLQDAIQLTRDLDIRYLWIDALCIIQGENGDWEKELLDMGDIYGQSLLTIAASSASSSDAGFLCRKNGAYWPVRHHHLFDSHATGDDPEVVTFKAYVPTWRGLNESLPLSDRGWVLQERMLASRTLSWTDDGIFWLCGEEDTSEYENPYHVVISHTTRLYEICEDVKKFVTTNNSYAQTDSDSNAERNDFSDRSCDGSPHLSKWYDLVMDLSKKAFTVASDRIPAITGLGKEIARIAGTKFENGMFKPTSARELCWVRDSTLSVRRIPGVPSWSWASLGQRVSFLTPQTDFQLLARGATVDGQQIHICGRLGALPVKDLHQQRWVSQRGFTVDEGVFFDVETDAPPGKEGIVKCIQWTTWTMWSARSIIEDKEEDLEHLRMLGIVLISAVDEAQQIYRRTGWAEVVDDGYFDEEFTDITLV